MSFTSSRPLQRNAVGRFVGLVLMYLFLLLLYVARLVTGQENAVNAARRDLLDRELVREESRMYIYGGRDELVASGDVESHAKEAFRKGYKVRWERFEEGRHVANVMVDGERYWRLVREAWEDD